MSKTPFIRNGPPCWTNQDCGGQRLKGALRREIAILHHVLAGIGLAAVLSAL